MKKLILLLSIVGLMSGILVVDLFAGPLIGGGEALEQTETADK